MDVLFDILQAVGIATAAGILLASLVLPLPSSAAPVAAVIAAVAGALLAGGDVEWYGRVIAAAGGAVAAVAAHQVLSGMRDRLSGTGAASTLPLYGVVAAPITGAITLVLAPVGAVVLLALIWLWIAARRRAAQKYEGLRILS